MSTEPKTLNEAQIMGDIRKATPFMITLSRSVIIRTIMSNRGYTQEVHREGWRMLHGLMSHQRYWLPGEDLPDTPQEQALDELDRLDNEYFTFAQACIVRRFPDQARYLFKNVHAVHGHEAVLMVKAYVERLQALREGSDPFRDATREADREAVRLLESRYVAGAEIEARLVGLIEQATSLPAIPDRDPYALSEAAYQALAREVRIWLQDWRDTARAAFQDRRYLIRLGLASPRKKRVKRRKAKPNAPVAPVMPASPVASEAPAEPECAADGPAPEAPADGPEPEAPADGPAPTEGGACHE